MVKSQEEAQNITVLFKGTFGTELGAKCLKHLEKVFVNREIARPGMSELEIGIRQGEANVIKKIIKEVNSNGR
jgi:hypothetical protein